MAGKNPDVINGVALKNLTLRGSELKPFAGADVYECITEAIQFCLPSLSHVTFIHNGRRFHVDAIKIVDGIHDNFERIPDSDSEEVDDS